MATAGSLIASVFLVILSFIIEKPAFYREYGSRTYRIMPYFMSKVLIEMPFQALYPFVSVTIAYFFYGLENTFQNYMVYLFTSVLIICSGSAYGLLLG
mmetsp:Transcript_12941/g.11464  ORF Transcript_12941/g.11464 Transcript_12941/m.11464 type:complete len:98 (-) Transcript_12941:409-702(-)